MKKEFNLDKFIGKRKSEKLFKKEKVKQSRNKNRGPPNRMNDLDYSTWMKFQKSFFFYSNNQDIIKNEINFFTKSIWENGHPSRSLVIGEPDFKREFIPEPRIIEKITDVNEIFHDIPEAKDTNIVNEFDYIFINLVNILELTKDIPEFIKKKVPKIFRFIKFHLKENRYCCFRIAPVNQKNNGFPLPWVFSEIGRKYLRLRDEKLILFEKHKSKIHYLVHFHKILEERKPNLIDPKNFRMSKINIEIPSYIIPKPPPRTKGEILHPAKFPETLIDEYILKFTQPYEIIFDPMAGTGSTIVSAVQNFRHCFGLELNSEFVELTKKRLRNKFPKPLLKIDRDKRPKFQIFKGNALELNKINQLKKIKGKVNYCITSPPYWSMLKNKGSEYQKSRRDLDLKTTYSDDDHDLGNIEDYNEFILKLTSIYEDVGKYFLTDSGFLTIIVKYIKRNHFFYPLPWDLAFNLSKPEGLYEFIGNTFWCQNDVGLKPFAVGIYWVSNTLHHYCLFFKKKGSYT